MKSKLVIWLFAFVSVYIVCNTKGYEANIYAYDASGYYRYLPSAFIYHDIGRMQFRKAGDANGFDYDDNALFLYEQKGTGRRTDQYPMGTALFELPGFMAAYACCTVAHSYRNDGYSRPFQVAGILSNILWVVLGLFVLRKFLLYYFSENVTCIVLLCIAFGTNLYYYTAFSQGMSHGYMFFLLSAIMYRMHLWYSTGKPAHMYWLGLLIGMVVITRPSNMIIVTLLFAWQVNSIESLKQRIGFLRHHLGSLLLAVVIFLPVAFVQMAYWRYTSGHWIHYSYDHIGFDFLHPHIWSGLFSYRKGWFVYTPLAFIGMLGFYSLWQKDKRLVPALLLYFLLTIYVVFSWKNWWYGGGFGGRPMIESLVLVAVPLGALIEQVVSRRKVLATASLSLVLAFCVALNLFQSYQFYLHIIHHDRMSRAYYWHVFGKTKIDFNESEQYLMDEKEYWRINSTL